MQFSLLAIPLNLDMKILNVRIKINGSNKQVNFIPAIVHHQHQNGSTLRQLDPVALGCIRLA